MARTTTSVTRTKRQGAKQVVKTATASRKGRKRVGAMSDEHKQALAAGRREGAAVKAYLDALEVAKPKRGRRRSPGGVERRLDEITAEMSGATPLHRLLLTQERRNLEAERQRLRTGGRLDLQELEDAFVAHASSFSQRKRIDYQTWRDVGVPPGVLKRAGIQRTPARAQPPAARPT